MVDVSLHGHLQRTGQSFEDTLNLMMFILSLCLDIQIHQSRIAQRLKEMEEHLGRHFANLFALKLRIPHQPGTATKIETDLAEAIIHRQGIAVTLDAPLTAQRLIEALAQRQTGVFNRVVLIDVEVAFHLNLQVDVTMFCNLLQHVIKEAQSGGDLAFARSIQVKRHMDIGLTRGTTHLRVAFAGKDKLAHLIPVW